MPESRVRKEAARKKYAKKRRQALEEKAETTRLASGGRDWVPWVFVPVGLLGVLWMIVWNLAGQSIGFLSALGNWNLLISLGFIVASLFLMTLWK
ncbi:cell division protein CrgA [Tessaracoccus sp. OH4464_COT-324]|uniref:cell division protein CrgA n=1 Tax=Tessaracoccus sp. OH4464_COT-324 TaxID=2491059 RepID=UPI000F632957|nr:cell division protein CrgA [Tessaracoccus sp. OH4464_COT-324]RRD45929.1 cell division protein CrgA [Tessaracoccus sp. OH4464_COT-324]